MPNGKWRCQTVAGSTANTGCGPFLWAAWVVASGLLLGCRAAAPPQALTVAAASDLQSALPDIVVGFEKDSGQRVRLTFGSSGNFFSQIENGAPFDVYLSADAEYPRRLERSGRAAQGTLYRYATGRIVLWARRDSGIDVSRGLAVLADAAVRRIAVANPEHAPYGRAAVAALRHEGVYDRVRDKLVLGENISQTAQFVRSGGADAGVLALSLARSPSLESAGVSFEIPADWHPPIEQTAVVLASSRQQALARQFIAYLQSPEAVRILRAYGFAVSERAR